jgi:PHD/YefM family antitoxin component YafN of YafNO toxin-antitoxin module
MNSISAQEIKHRGISAVDEALVQGPVHIIKDNRPQYVVLSEERYKAIVENLEDAKLARLQASLDDVAAGRVQRGSAADLIRQLQLEE